MKNDLSILFSDEFGRSVEVNLDRDPMRIALDGRVPNAALVASQVKYLKRAERKLPSYYAARCILPPLAFEQSSSEAAAARKVGTQTADFFHAHNLTRNNVNGLAIDLTCGLGVDSFHLSKRFGRVIALERDETLAAVARENFRRLGADNIEVFNTSAEEFLSASSPMTVKIFGINNKSAVGVPTADLVYVDPDRRGGGNARGGYDIRDGGKKMVRVEDCSPDIAALIPRIRTIAPRLVVKLSPMFDVDEVFRVFGPAGTGVEVVSLDGECKEIIAGVSFDSQSMPTVRAVAIGIGRYEAGHGDPPPSDGAHEPEKYRYLVIPDVALQKARLARRYFSERGIRIDSDNGYGFATAEPRAIMGKVLEIESMEPFDPKRLKRRLKTQGIRSIDILKREFPLSAADIARQLGVREGGAQKIAFTRAAGCLWQITLK